MGETSDNRPSQHSQTSKRNESSISEDKSHDSALNSKADSIYTSYQVDLIEKARISKNRRNRTTSSSTQIPSGNFRPDKPQNTSKNYKNATKKPAKFGKPDKIPHGTASSLYLGNRRDTVQSNFSASFKNMSKSLHNFKKFWLKLVIHINNLALWEYILLNLIISDFMYCLMIPILVSETALDQWLFSSTACKISSFATLLNLFASVYFICWMALHRCSKVGSSPFHIFKIVFCYHQFQKLFLKILPWQGNNSLNLTPKLGVAGRKSSSNTLKRRVTTRYRHAMTTEYTTKDSRHLKAGCIWVIAGLISIQALLFRAKMEENDGFEVTSIDPNQTLSKKYFDPVKDNWNEFEQTLDPSNARSRRETAQDYSNRAAKQEDNQDLTLEQKKFLAALHLNVTHRTAHRCVWAYRDDQHKQIMETVLFYSKTIFGFLLPMILIVLSYTSAATIILEHAHNHKSSKCSKSNKMNERIQRTVNVIALCTASYLICWIPNWRGFWNFETVVK